MNIGEKILAELDIIGMKKSELARKSGVAYTTLDSMIKRNPDSVNVRTLFKIAETLGVSADYLARDEITDRNYVSRSATDVPSGVTIPKKYRQMLDVYGRMKSSNDPKDCAAVSAIDKLLGIDEKEADE